MKKFLIKLNNVLKTSSSTLILFLGFTILLLIGYIDQKIAFTYSFSLFYVIPILFTTWYKNLGFGLLFSVLGTTVWFLVDSHSERNYQNEFIPYWNSFIRFGYFVLSSFLLGVIKKKLDEEELLADTDNLTGLVNSRKFYESLDIELLRSKRSLIPFTLVYLDLDNFKFVNDNMGHPEGDRVLKSVSDMLLLNSRSIDTIARLGGDEFICLFLNVSMSEYADLYKKKIKSLQEQMQVNNWPITFSVGALTVDKFEISVNDLVSHVDQLMYSVKKKGKNNLIHKNLSELL